MYKIVALIGEAGAGKDTIMQDVLALRPEFHEIISCTSRPIREGEKEGVNYFYYSEEDFMDKIISGDMLESTAFNGWFYGTGKDSVVEDAINIGVFNPAGIYSLLNNPNVDLRVVRVWADDKTRMLRQLNREENPNCAEIARRFIADQEDFKALSFDYELVDNVGNYDRQSAIGSILCWTETWFDQGRD